jgi:hypothetical protein
MPVTGRCHFGLPWRSVLCSLLFYLGFLCFVACPVACAQSLAPVSPKVVPRANVADSILISTGPVLPWLGSRLPSAAATGRKLKTRLCKHHMQETVSLS